MKLRMNYSENVFECSSNDAYSHLKTLKTPGSNFWIHTESTVLNFWIELDKSLWVEIVSSKNNFWALSKIDYTIAEEMLRMVDKNQGFGEFKPTTNKNWDGYSL